MAVKCAGCDKPITEGEDSIFVDEGTLRSGGNLKGRKKWGRFHRSCFNRSIDSPDAIWEEIQNHPGPSLDE